MTPAPRGDRLSDRPWLVVAGSALALTVGNGPVMQFTFGVFLKPLSAAFGIDRATASLALTIGLLATAIAMPFAGRLADRLGPRRVGLTAAPLFAAGVAAAGLLSRSVGMFMALFLLAGIAAAGQTPLIYLKAIAARIDRSRGLALAIALTGVGVGSIVMPLIAQRLIDAAGWRDAYAGIALLLLVVAMPALLLFIPGRDPPAGFERLDPIDDGVGPDWTAAIGDARFWRLAICMFLAAAAANGTIAHVGPLLTDRGVSPSEAASALALVGGAAIAGRLGGGYLLDRFWAPLVATIFFAGMIGGILLLLAAHDLAGASAATVLLGLGLGVEADLVGFLISRYFGTRAFGSLFGLVFASFMLGSSLGPIFMGAVFDATGSYTAALTALIGCAFVAGAGLLTLGSYRYPARLGAAS